jgi:hypothetical protein
VWLLREWPRDERAPTKYYLSSLPVTTSLRTLHTQRGGRFAGGHTDDTFKVIGGDAVGAAPESLPLGFRPCESSPDSLRDSGALELSDRVQNVHLELASRRRGVDALRPRHEPNAQAGEFLERHHEVPEVAVPAGPSAKQKERRSDRRAAVSRVSSAGRRSLAPLTPRSTNSVAAQPRASA